jgi:vitamin B12/bleomycin/antimicrobial peptide transport system ATP-binding/permease protein
VDYHQSTLELAEDHSWAIKPSGLATADL